MSSKNSKPFLNIQLLSDGTGETALAVLKSVLIQYEYEDYVKISKHRSIKTKEQIESILQKISQKKEDQIHLVVYTLIMPESRKCLKDLCKKYKIRGVDLLEELIDILDKTLTSKKKQAGILRLVNEDYFKRIEAMDFFLKHDDGQLTNELEDADIILVGVSRTSKTPLSLYLSNKGWKVANIPLVYNIDPPKNLFEVDQKKVIALTIDPNYLFKIRKNRLEKFGYDPGGSYADKDKVYREVTEIQSLFQKHRWPVINVTDRALEETAAEIIRIVSMRMKLPIKII
ncbi:MAG: pyruvate, water dikinase regulatory protein [Bdellovibrionales bacterium]